MRMGSTKIRASRIAFKKPIVAGPDVLEERAHMAGERQRVETGNGSHWVRRPAKRPVE